MPSWGWKPIALAPHGGSVGGEMEQQTQKKWEEGAGE